MDLPKTIVLKKRINKIAKITAMPEIWLAGKPLFSSPVSWR